MVALSPFLLNLTDMLPKGLFIKNARWWFPFLSVMPWKGFLGIGTPNGVRLVGTVLLVELIFDLTEAVEQHALSRAFVTSAAGTAAGFWSMTVDIFDDASGLPIF